MEAPTTRTCNKCGETKDLELFEKDKEKKFGRRPTCKTCRYEARKHYNKSPKKKNTSKVKVKNEEVPLIKTCSRCKETKEIDLFRTNNAKKFGRDSICKKCDILKSKQYRAKRGPKKPYLNHKEPPPTITCIVCKQTKESQFFVKDKNKKYGIRYRCLECEKIKGKEKYKRRNHSGLLTTSYLKKLVTVNLKIHSSQVTDEQIQLQKESILLHRDYKELKLFFEQPESQRELQREREESKLLLNQPPLTRTCKNCRETKEIELFSNCKQYKFGKRLTCKECYAIEKRKYYAEKKGKTYQIEYFKPKPIAPPGSRACTKCGEVKEFKFFYKSSRSKFGILPFCKECDTKIKKKHYTYKKKEYLQELSGTRTCKKCEETKSLELFIEAPNCKFGRRLVCKECGEKGKKRYYKYEKKLSAERPITRTCRCCKESKELELFTNVATCRFGKSHVCKECSVKESKKYYQINKDKRKSVRKICRIGSEKSKESKQQPLTKICRTCNETKEFEVFKIDKRAKFGRANTCNKCVTEKNKQWLASNEHRKEKYREKARIYQRIHFNKNYRENKIKMREQNKKCQKKQIINLGKSYLKSVLSHKLKLPFKDVTDEQVELQRESIQLHREFKQLKQQLQ